MLAHDCFYNFFPVPIMKLFPKYECNHNLRRKITFCDQNQILKFFASPLVTKPYLFGILVTIVHVKSHAKAYLKIFLNAELHAKRLVYKYITIFLK